MILPKFYKGQTLVIILLGTSVALTVALAVSVRTISSLKQTATTARSQAALAAAEAGAEVGLARIASAAAGDAACKTLSGCVGSGTISETSTTYSYTAAAAGSSTDAYLVDLARDQSQEIKLDGYPSGGSLKICWYDPGLDGSAINALELIYVDSAGTMTKSAYNGDASLGTNGFTAPPGPGQVSVAGHTVSFQHCQVVSTPGTPKILRVKALYNNVSAAVEPQGGASLPVQAYRVESTGQTSDGSVTKKVRVTKSLPSLPSIFDFGLFSGSATQPLSK